MAQEEKVDLKHFEKTTVGDFLANSDHSSSEEQAYVFIPYPDTVEQVRGEFSEDYMKWIDSFKNKKWFRKWLNRFELKYYPKKKGSSKKRKNAAKISEGSIKKAKKEPKSEKSDEFEPNEEHQDTSNIEVQCFVCKETVSSILTHLKIEHPELASNQCQECFRVFRTASSFEAHIFRHQGIKPYKCQFESCNERFASAQNRYHHHKWKHDPNKIDFPCKHCKYVAKSRCLLEIHTRTHSGVKPYKCHICGVAFAQTSTLNQHIDRHKKLKKFKCVECDMTFLMKGDLTRHYEFKHTDQATIRSKHQCVTCRKTFGMRSSLKKHMAMHDKSISNPTMCVLCPKPFAGLQSLRRHLIYIHAVEKCSDAYDTEEGEIIKCALCLDRAPKYLSKYTFSVHLRQSHVPRREELRCDACDLVVSRKDSLKLHKKRMHGEKSQENNADETESTGQE